MEESKSSYKHSNASLEDFLFGYVVNGAGFKKHAALSALRCDIASICDIALRYQHYQHATKENESSAGLLDNRRERNLKAREDVNDEPGQLAPQLHADPIRKPYKSPKKL